MTGRTSVPLEFLVSVQVQDPKCPRCGEDRVQLDTQVPWDHKCCKTQLPSEGVPWKENIALKSGYGLCYETQDLQSPLESSSLCLSVRVVLGWCTGSCCRGWEGALIGFSRAQGAWLLPAASSPLSCTLQPLPPEMDHEP